MLHPCSGTDGAVGAGVGAIGVAGAGCWHHGTPEHPTSTVDHPEGGYEDDDGPEVQGSDLVSAVERVTVAAAEDVDDAVKKDVGGYGRSN